MTTVNIQVCVCEKEPITIQCQNFKAKAFFNSQIVACSNKGKYLFNFRCQISTILKNTMKKLPAMSQTGEQQEKMH